MFVYCSKAKIHFKHTAVKKIFCNYSHQLIENIYGKPSWKELITNVVPFSAIMSIFLYKQFEYNSVCMHVHSDINYWTDYL